MASTPRSKPGGTKRAPDEPAPGPRLHIRVDFGPGVRLGPGKVALLEAIAAGGSISAAGRELHMSYRRAWELVDELNASFGAKLVLAGAGGARGGGASVTSEGRAVIDTYRRLERVLGETAARELRGLEASLAIPDRV